MILVALCLIGALIVPVWRWAGTAIVLASGLCLFALSTPAVSSGLMRWAEAGSSSPGDLSGAQAIVVLGGSVILGDGHDIPDVLGPVSLERVDFAAQAYRQLHLPVLVSGGRPRQGHASEAALMKAALDQDFGVPVKWVEDRSRTTWDNAVYSAELLRPAGLHTVVLVSQAWHLPRAVWSFERAGLKALPWPAPRAASQFDGPRDFLPEIAALHDSLRALHEIVGMAYYRLRH